MREFPAKVVDILDPGVHSLPSRGGVDVRGIACQEGATDAIAVHHAHVGPIERKPGGIVQPDMYAD